MTVQAAIDGLGVAMGHTAYVADDIAQGRLVVPFDITMPSAGYYFVTPQDKVMTPAISAFRDWLIETSRVPQEQALASHSKQASVLR
jgi:LysR family glycine cleavage system transcriptional activator